MSFASLVELAAQSRGFLKNNGGSPQVTLDPNYYWPSGKPGVGECLQVPVTASKNGEHTKFSPLAVLKVIVGGVFPS